MSVPPLDPSSVAAAKEPEAKPLFSDKSVTITNHAVIISGKQYKLSEIEEVSTDKDNWQTAVSLSCLAASVCFYVFSPSKNYHLPWKPEGQLTSVFSTFFLLSMVFGIWGSALLKLVFKLPTGYLVVSKGDRSWTKMIKAEIDRARIVSTPIASAGSPDDTNRPG
jgi:hypothetical protein